MQAGAQVVAFIGTFVLAHLLSPTTLGMVAFGTTIVTVGTFFADGGLGAALIRRADNSDRRRAPSASRPAARLGVRDRAGSDGRRISGRNNRSRHGDHGLVAPAPGPQSATRDRAGASARLPADSGHRVRRVARLLRLGDRDGRGGLGRLGRRFGSDRACPRRFGADDARRRH